MTIYEVKVPAGFIPSAAIAFGDSDGQATAVSGANPLPVAIAPAQVAATSTPLSGSTSAASSVVGPFTPVLMRSIMLTLSGTWTGSAQLLRSIDGGTTKLPLTLSDGTVKGLFRSAINAVVAEESVAGATYYLSIQLSSGTLSYRMEQ